MFRVKICGVRLKQDLDSVESSGADAVGLNFYPPSIRYLDPRLDSTHQLSLTAKNANLLRVGVFVNETVASMTEVSQRVGLDAIQLHGDEPIEIASNLIYEGYRVIRAIKLPRTEMTVNQIQEKAIAWSALGCHLILDADAGAAHGGSGKTLHWSSVRSWAEKHPDAKWTLAGGLKPENVAEAVAQSMATSVDTASGVECPKGVKNHDRVMAFAAASGLAFPS